MAFVRKARIFAFILLILGTTFTFTVPMFAANAPLYGSKCDSTNTKTIKIDGKDTIVYKNGILTGVPCVGAIDSKEEVIQVVKNVIFIFLLPLVGTLFLIMLIVGGILYITSRGNTQQLERAKKTLTAAIVGLLIVTLSYTIIAIFANVIGGSIT